MKTVSEGTIHITYEIREDDSYPSDEYRFDWFLSNGDESDENFKSAEEAEADMRSRF